MAKRQKEKLFEDIQFQDVEKAKKVYTFAKINQIRILIGFIIAIASTIFTVIGLNGNSGAYTWALLLAIPAYLIGGGIFKALGVAWKITKIGWFLIPVFPADVLFSIAFFFISFFLLLFVPIVFVGMNYVQHKKTLDAATSYLATCGVEVDTMSSSGSQE